MTTLSKEQKKGRHRLPVFQGILPISWRFIPAEIIAGMTLAALGIPEVMGYTKIAGTPVITGLYALLLPVLVFAILGSSRPLVVGADSATAAIIAAGLVGLAAQDTPQYVALAIIAGVFLILARLLAKSVLIGFLTGVGIQVALGQVGGMLGVQTSGGGMIQKFASELQQLPQACIPTVIISLVVLLIIIITSKINDKIPGALIAVVCMIIASYAFNFSSTFGISWTFVVNGNPTKTEIVDSAGGRTQIAQITTAFIVLLVLVFLTAPLSSSWSAYAW